VILAIVVALALLQSPHPPGDTVWHVHDLPSSTLMTLKGSGELAPITLAGNLGSADMTFRLVESSGASIASLSGDRTLTVNCEAAAAQADNADAVVDFTAELSRRLCEQAVTDVIVCERGAQCVSRLAHGKPLTIPEPPALDIGVVTLTGCNRHPGCTDLDTFTFGPSEAK
jgi:hypothetical protein